MSSRTFVELVVIGFVLLGTNGCATQSSRGHIPYGREAHSIPGVIEAEHYDEGPPGVAYLDVDEVNHGADYRNDTQVDIEKRDDASNGHGVGWTRAGEWLAYTVSVESTGDYRIEFPVASNMRGGTFHIAMNGNDVTGPIAVPDTGGWSKLKMIQVDGVRLKQGLQVMTMVMDTEGESGSIGDIDYIRFTRRSLGLIDSSPRVR